MRDIDSEEDEVTIDSQSTSYCVEYPLCGTEFAVWNLIKQHPSGLGYSAARNDDIIQLYCPICGEKFPLAVAKAP